MSAYLIVSIESPAPAVWCGVQTKLSLGDHVKLSRKTYLIAEYGNVYKARNSCGVLT